jgi:ELWxxDGT repeat protein
MKKSILLIALCCSTITNALKPTLLRDIAVGKNSSGGFSYTALNGKTIFSADDNIHGKELWITDGTRSGTTLLKDINPGAGSSYPYFPVVIGTKAYFAADDGVHGSELWVTDGTAAGTTMLKDIYTGTGNASPSGFTAYKGKVYFSAIDSAHGQEQWVTDGTAAGTVLFRDFNPGKSYGGGGDMIVLNNLLIFAADDGSHGLQLWQSDGTTAGTFKYININPSAQFEYVGYYVEYQSKLYFAANDSIHGRELWVTDGTAAGTSMLKDINTFGKKNSDPRAMIVFQNKLYFWANDSTHGDEPWVTDGTAAGTTLLKDINPIPLQQSSTYAPGSALIFIPDPSYTIYGNKLYFNAYEDSTKGFEPWVSDGTAAGTHLFKDLIPSSNTTLTSSYPSSFTPYLGKMYFTAYDTNRSYSLWVTDGNPDSTHTIIADVSNYRKNKYQQPFALLPNNQLTICNNLVFFTATYDTTTGAETYILADPTTGIDDVTAYAYHIAPNPASTSITITGITEPTDVSITDISGQVLLQHHIDELHNRVSLAELSSGMYFVQLSSRRGQVNTLKLLKE